MKEALQILLIVALLKFLGVPMGLIGIGCFLYAIGSALWLYADVTDQKRKERDAAMTEARKKQKAEEAREAERIRQEELADVEWRARFV
jgi:hypothetical protein